MSRAMHHGQWWCIVGLQPSSYFSISLNEASTSPAVRWRILSFYYNHWSIMLIWKYTVEINVYDPTVETLFYITFYGRQWYQYFSNKSNIFVATDFCITAKYLPVSNGIYMAFATTSNVKDRDVHHEMCAKGTFWISRNVFRTRNI